MTSRSSNPEIAPEIRAYYDAFPEEERLQLGPGQLEYVRTLELLSRYLPSPPALVLDVGGGPGVYSQWLADRGYEAHLIEPVPRQVEYARARAAKAERPIARCVVGDARQLDVPDEHADAMLLMGPLYHLTDAQERQRALAEARRVLKPGGVLFGAAISRFASALDGLARDLLRDPDFVAIVKSDLADGQHRNITNRLDYWTTAYLHQPEELGREIQAAGFHVEGVFGVEGPAWLLGDFEARWQNPERRAELLDIVRRLEREPSMLGVSAHLIAVARRPE
ncbi:MAG TPA: methyltransferase domain-containing protein [Gemmatimonadaceae bacterium]|nr:methyltransferase domain-containing protein [Gemmatimonadaceae bacterium]